VGVPPAEVVKRGNNGEQREVPLYFKVRARACVCVARDRRVVLVWVVRSRSITLITRANTRVRAHTHTSGVRPAGQPQGDLPHVHARGRVQLLQRHAHHLVRLGHHLPRHPLARVLGGGASPTVNISFRVAVPIVVRPSRPDYRLYVCVCACLCHGQHGRAGPSGTAWGGRWHEKPANSQFGLRWPSTSTLLNLWTRRIDRQPITIDHQTRGSPRRISNPPAHRLPRTALIHKRRASL
jgi:hypothetical protein